VGPATGVAATLRVTGATRGDERIRTRGGRPVRRRANGNGTNVPFLAFGDLDGRTIPHALGGRALSVGNTRWTLARCARTRFG
jgi:hypothetical protein